MSVSGYNQQKNWCSFVWLFKYFLCVCVQVLKSVSFSFHFVDIIWPIVCLFAPSFSRMSWSDLNLMNFYQLFHYIYSILFLVGLCLYSSTQSDHSACECVRFTFKNVHKYRQKHEDEQINRDPHKIYTRIGNRKKTHSIQMHFRYLFFLFVVDG